MVLCPGRRASPHSVATTLRDDLSKEKPAYYLSVYSCQKCAPNLIDGTDVSPEELRFQAYQARANNTTSQYIAHESQLLQQMDAVIRTVNENTLESYKHFFHTRIPLNSPNSTFRQATSGLTFGGGASFGSTTPAGPFGKPSSTFGGPPGGAFAAIGSQASTSGVSAFGSQAATSTVSAFGPQAVAPTVSAFGQPSSVRPAVSAFGQPTSGFGASTPSQPNAVTAFGKPSAFGAAASNATAFGGTPVTSAFGQPSQFGSTTAFGAAPSGQPKAVTAFGAPSAFGASAQPNTTGNVSAFAQTALNNSATAFGQPSMANPSASFGQPSTFGQPQVPTAFGKPSPFGQAAFGKQVPLAPAASNPPSNTSAAFGQPVFGATVSAFGQATPFGAATTSNQTAGSGGFSAFAGSSNPSLTATFANNSTNSIASTVSKAPQTQDASTAPSGNATSFVNPAGQSNQAKNQAKNQKSNYRPAEDIKLLDPFWEDAPNEADLPSEILKAFKADCFSWELIPNVAPPITLR